MTISLSDLKALRAAMTQGPYRYDHQGWIESMSRTINHTGGETEVLTLGARNEPDDGIGIVATHNAADVLIEIAESASVVLKMFDDPNTDPWWGVAGADARFALREALAKVRP